LEKSLTFDQSMTSLTARMETDSQTPLFEDSDDQSLNDSYNLAMEEIEQKTSDTEASEEVTNAQ
jgi:hypothetical protein